MRQARTFPAETASLPALMAFVESQAEALGLHPKRALQLQLAIEEAVVNICNYAYERPPGEVTVTTELAGDQLMIELRDEGIPFDPLAIDAPDLQAPLEDRKLGGLGIFLLGKVVDEVHYRREGTWNVLTMRLANSR